MLNKLTVKLKHLLHLQQQQQTKNSKQNKQIVVEHENIEIMQSIIVLCRSCAVYFFLY